MKLIVRAGAVIKSGPERELIDDYIDRASGLARNLGISVIEEQQVDLRSKKTRKDESLAIIVEAKPGQITVFMDERGKALTSRQMAQQIARWRDDGHSECVFLIGPPDGFDRESMPCHALMWQLGKPVWPHKLLRVMLCEQIYRAFSILAGTPYHRD